MTVANLNAPVRRSIVIAAHLAIWAGAYGGAYLLRFEGNVPAQELRPAAYALLLLLLLRTASFWFTGLFHGIMRYAGVPEVIQIFKATTAATVVLIGASVLMPDHLRLPRSVYAGEWLLATLGAAGLRLAIRMLRERRYVRPDTSGLKPALVVGAGDAGETLLRDLERVRQSKWKPVALLDDNPGTHGSELHGVRVLGPADEKSLRRAKEDLGVELVILAIPTASGSRTREIVSTCRELGLETKTLPGLHQLLSGEARVSMLRDVAIEDLLRREPVTLDEESMGRFLRDKRVLVTGGAGSIGSELARQALRFGPAAVALVDHNENGLFFLERRLTKVAEGAQVQTIVADIKDARRMNEVFREVQPDVVLHAAAHKHVPLMEQNPGEAIKNNVFGTKIVADFANLYRVETFVLVSTDKAVNPTSVMGASKRIAEMYVQSLSEQQHTRFVAVRFGNVLGSAGSVVQIFREQIASGGPLTVTHPEMKRYFMTISEACQLVLQAGALADGGEIFLLDMGEPVKVVDLARDMIRMSGYEPDVDIAITFTGARPGEKLFEELLNPNEEDVRQVHPQILVGRIPTVAPEAIATAIGELPAKIDGGTPEVRKAIAALVPEAQLGGGNVRTVDDEGTVKSLEPFELDAMRPSRV